MKILNRHKRQRNIVLEREREFNKFLSFLNEIGSIHTMTPTLKLKLKQKFK